MMIQEYKKQLNFLLREREILRENMILTKSKIGHNLFWNKLKENEKNIDKIQFKIKLLEEINKQWK